MQFLQKQEGSWCAPTLIATSLKTGIQSFVEKLLVVRVFQKVKRIFFVYKIHKMY